MEQYNGLLSEARIAIKEGRFLDAFMSYGKIAMDHSEVVLKKMDTDVTFISGYGPLVTDICGDFEKTFYSCKEHMQKDTALINSYTGSEEQKEGLVYAMLFFDGLLEKLKKLEQRDTVEFFAEGGGLERIKELYESSGETQEIAELVEGVRTQYKTSGMYLLQSMVLTLEELLDIGGNVFLVEKYVEYVTAFDAMKRESKNHKNVGDTFNVLRLITVCRLIKNYDQGYNIKEKFEALKVKKEFVDLVDYIVCSEKRQELKQKLENIKEERLKLQAKKDELDSEIKALREKPAGEVPADKVYVQKQKEIDDLLQEKNNIGFFAFGKKNEIKAKIAEKSQELIKIEVLVSEQRAEVKRANCEEAKELEVKRAELEKEDTDNNLIIYMTVIESLGDSVDSFKKAELLRKQILKK